MFNHDLSSYFQKNNKNKLYILALAFGVLLFLSGCKSAELKAMENSTSIIQLTTGREVSISLRDKHRGIVGPVYAQIILVYEPINNHTNKDVYDEIVAILKKNNWEGSEPIMGDDEYFKATLQQGGFEIIADVVIDSKKNHVTIIMRIY